jgi:two-component system, NtrC family, sensor kinase
LFLNLSFRYKIPLRGSVLIVITAAVITASIMFRVYENLKQDVQFNAAAMARMMAHTVTTAILHDDVWRTYELIGSPLRASPKDNVNRPEEIIVLTPGHRVYISTHPKLYPMLSDPAQGNPDLASLQEAAIRDGGAEPHAVEPPGSGKFYMVTGIVSDGVPLGTLVMVYSNMTFLPRFLDLVWRAGMITLLALAAVLPVAWYWAWRMADPLTRLATCMGLAGTSLEKAAAYRLYESKDEIGQVGMALRRMLSALREKEALEKQMVHSERLAAVGRLAGGIAHEINNPLGGMLNAISTFKKHGGDDPQSVKTISLLERGLLQIKNTIAALLVEAKIENHPLTVQDIEDTRTLVLSDANSKNAELRWENDVIETLPLPSTLVRQILINLLLNAIQAAEHRGRVRCHIYRDSASLILLVENGGKHIAREQMSYLFEPFATAREGGCGLGLWVIYQITQQLNGNIAVESEPGDTRFKVTLPIAEERA